MPQIVIFAGPNGAGKSSASAALLKEIGTYLNADDMAKELVATGIANPDFAAGRLLLNRWDELEAERANFAVETTLATKSFAARLKRMQRTGYHVSVIYLWLPDVEISIQRVQERVLHGGHSIPEDVIRRRYDAGLRNFFTIYAPKANTWKLYDNSAFAQPSLIARGTLKIQKDEIWYKLQDQMG